MFYLETYCMRIAQEFDGFFERKRFIFLKHVNESEETEHETLLNPSNFFTRIVCSGCYSTNNRNTILWYFW